jgi:hypothetical protein
LLLLLLLFLLLLTTNKWPLFNKSLLFTFTQHTFNVIHLVNFAYMPLISACTLEFVRDVNTNTLQRKAQ